MQDENKTTTPSVTSEKPQSKDNMTINTVTILLLIFFYPIGLIVMWVATKWKVWVKVLISSWLLIIGLFAILATVTLIAINPAERFKEARNVKRAADIVAIQQGLISHYTQQGYYPNSIVELVPEYIATEPLDPLEQPYLYEVELDGTNYILCYSLETSSDTRTECVTSEGEQFIQDDVHTMQE